MKRWHTARKRRVKSAKKKKKIKEKNKKFGKNSITFPNFVTRYKISKYYYSKTQNKL